MAKATGEEWHPSCGSTRGERESGADVAQGESQRAKSLTKSAMLYFSNFASSLKPRKDRRCCARA